MTPYSNLGGNSAISAYESSQGYIREMFTTGAMYLYDNTRPGEVM